jgi:hypothetical protein
MGVSDAMFEIDGRSYEWPGLLNLTVRECRIFYEETGVVWESLWLDGLTVADLFKMPGALAAMARIAYVREHPEARDEDVKVLIDDQPAASLLAVGMRAFSGDSEPSEDPKAPGATGEPGSSSPTSSGPSSTPNGTSDQPPISGPSSTESSVPPVVAHGTIGTGESDGRSMSPPLRRVI